MPARGHHRPKPDPLVAEIVTYRSTQEYPDVTATVEDAFVERITAGWTFVGWWWDEVGGVECEIMWTRGRPGS